MKKYYIEHACGNFTAPIEYAEKSEAEIIEDIRGDYPEYMTIAEFNSKDEAMIAINNYHNFISVQKNGDRALVDYHIYEIGEGDEDDD